LRHKEILDSQENTFNILLLNSKNLQKILEGFWSLVQRLKNVKGLVLSPVVL
jgi:hypothetical protein